jgi:hypothetical protein
MLLCAMPSFCKQFQKHHKFSFRHQHMSHFTMASSSGCCSNIASRQYLRLLASQGNGRLRSSLYENSTRHLSSVIFCSDDRMKNSWNTSTQTTLRRASSTANNLKKGPSRNSISNFKSNNHQRRNKASPAAILMDQWETSMTNNNSANGNHNRVQRKRFEERQRVFCDTVVQYRDIWFKPDKSNIVTEWRHAMQFQHPTAGSYQFLVQSEPAFAQICSLCHELFVTTALLAESEQGTTQTHKDSIEFLSSVLPFWETMRKDRAALVERYSAAGEQPQVVQMPERAESAKYKGNWVKWIKSIVGGADASDVEPAPPQQPIKLTAHQDPQYAPNHYHYNKLVGRLYFSFPPLVALQVPTDESQEQRLMEVLEQRASIIQRLFDQVPQYASDGKGTTVRSPVLTDKTVRLLIRAYQDIGTLDAGYKTEQVYHRYPAHRKGLLWYVLMSYLQVTQRDATSTPTSASNPGRPQISKKFSPKSASLATKRVCELLSKQVQTNMNPNEFHSCATIGFQCLANIAVPSLDRYYERVHALAALKFGSSTWEALMSPKSNKENLQLRSKDSASLQLLVQIYAKKDEDEYLEKAKGLLDNMWKAYSITELKESLARSTFHSILEAIDKKRGRARQDEKSNQDDDSNVAPGDVGSSSQNGQDFEYALGLFDKMMSNEFWLPNAETFNFLFRLAEYGPQADQVSTRLELCRVIAQEYPMSPFIASKHALRAWNNTAKQGDNQDEGMAMERALAILQRLQVSSRPLLFQANPEVVSHIYDVKDAPSPIFYSLVWEACFFTGKKGSAKTKERAVEIALTLYHASKKHDIESFSATAYSNFLRCLAMSDEEEQRLTLVRDVFESAKQDSSKSMDSSLLEALLDCLLVSNGEEQAFQQQRLELIQDIYHVVVSTHEIPVMTERFLTLLGHVHPQLHEHHLAEHQKMSNHECS